MVEWDCSAFLDSILKDVIPRAKDNCKYLQPFTNLPHMEPRLHQIYTEAYIITLLGFPNVSLILQGILLEALVKEIIFEKEKSQFQKTFGAAINRCISKGYIEHDEYDFLYRFKENIRNPYQHIDIEKITGESSVLAWRIPVDKEDVAGSMLRGVQNWHKGIAGPPEILTVKDLRVVGAVIKKEVDEENYLIQFLEVAWFVRMMARKYIPTN